MKRLLLGLLLITGLYSYAQEKHTISGTIKEKRSGEVLIGASAYLMELPKTGTVSNAYGFYSITAPAGNYTLIVSFAGFTQDSVKIILDKNISVPIGNLLQGKA